MGCLLGYPSEIGDPPVCVPLFSPFTAQFVGSKEISYKSFRVFLPKGTTHFNLYTLVAGTGRYTVAMRLGRPPSKKGKPSTADIKKILANSSSGDFAKLISGKEVHRTSDNENAATKPWGLITSPAALKTPLAKGEWLYVRTLESSRVEDLSANYAFDRDSFKQGYDELSFDDAGDPLIASSGTGGGSGSDDEFKMDEVPSAPELTALALERAGTLEGPAYAEGDPDWDTALFIRVVPVPAEAILPPLIITPRTRHAPVSVSAHKVVFQKGGPATSPLPGFDTYTVTAGAHQIRFSNR